MTTFPKKIFSLLLIWNIFFATGLSAQVKRSAAPLVLTSFNTKNIPDSLSTAACNFSESLQDFYNNKYILYYQVTGRKYAIVKVNNRMCYLRLTNSLNDTCQVFSNALYTLTLKTQSAKTRGDVAYQLTGKMTLKNKSGQSISINLFGNCGD